MGQFNAHSVAMTTIGNSLPSLGKWSGQDQERTMVSEVPKKGRKKTFIKCKFHETFALQKRKPASYWVWRTDTQGYLVLHKRLSRN